MSAKITRTQKEKFTHGAAFVTVAGICIEAASWDRGTQLMLFPLFAALGLAGWISLYRHYRAIHNTPTSEIGYAGTGYVELVGTSAMLPGSPLLTPGGTACCWYNARDFNRITGWGNKYRPSTKPFLMVDDTGVCVILPEGSGQIGTAHESRWSNGEKKGHAYMLLPGDALCAAGELTTLQAAAPELAAKLAHLDIKALLTLVRKADREALQRETPQRAAANPAVAEMLALRKPRDGRLFWIANEAPETLEPNVRFGTWLLLAFFIYFAAGFIWLVS